jgi:flavorubredoxin
MITELAKGVHWVGAVDWGLRHFHGHELSTHRGSSYNAYLIVDEKIVLVDTVWEPFADQLMQNIRQVVDPAKIDIVVANHGETDHSGSLAAVLREARGAELVVSKRGQASIFGHYHQDWNFRPVGTGDRIPIGSRELVFLETPMIHWPDSMCTFLTGSNILMPNDAFGQHYASAFRFNDQVPREALYHEAMKYYANIITPFSDMVLRKIDELLAMNWPVEMIAPSHGIIWRQEPMQIVRTYQEWASQKPQATAVILYDTMWNATRKMAEAIADGLAAANVPCKLFHMAVSDRNDVITEIFQARAILIGSPTLNHGLLPSITPILEDIKGLAFKNKIGVAFSSYGWSGEGLKIIQEHLQKCKIPLVCEGVSVKWQPTADDLQACFNMGQQVAKSIKGA